MNKFRIDFYQYPLHQMSDRKNRGNDDQRGFLNPFKDMESLFDDPFSMMKRSNDIFAQHFT